MHISQHIQSQIYDFISHRFSNISVDRHSMETPIWTLSVTGEYSLSLFVTKGMPFTVVVEEVVSTNYGEKALKDAKDIESALNDNIKYE